MSVTVATESKPVWLDHFHCPQPDALRGALAESFGMTPDGRPLDNNSHVNDKEGA